MLFFVVLLDVKVLPYLSEYANSFTNKITHEQNMIFKTNITTKNSFALRILPFLEMISLLVINFYAMKVISQLKKSNLNFCFFFDKPCVEGNDPVSQP